MTNTAKKKIVPDGLALKQFQIDGVRRLYRFMLDNKRAYLGDEQGCGKTIQTLALINALELDRVLIICPASLRLNWREEAKLWLMDDYDIVPLLTGASASKISSEQCRTVVICSYDLVHSKKVLPVLMDREWDILIFDEAQNLGNEETLRTKACLDNLWHKAELRLALSGTPIPNKTQQAFPLFSRMCPKHPKLHNFNAFSRSFLRGQDNGFGWEWIGGKNLRELGQIAAENFMVRRTQAQVLKDLPEKINQRLMVKVTVKGSKYKSTEGLGKILAQKIAAAEDFEAYDESSKEMLSTIARERKILGLAKVQRAVELVVQELEHEKKIVCFCWHKDVVKELESKLVKKGIKVACLTGATSPEAKHTIVTHFQSTPIEAPQGIQVLIGNIISAGVGLTLTAAKLAIFVEYSLVPADMMQAVKRLHRMGQTHVVRNIFMVAEKSMDIDCINMLVRKMNEIDKVLKEVEKKNDE